jgi:hypothetical protein
MIHENLNDLSDTNAKLKRLTYAFGLQYKTLPPLYLIRGPFTLHHLPKSFVV